MPERRVRRLYLDACVFLSYINGDKDRLPDIDAVFDEATRDEVELLTSTVSIVEVAFGKAEQDAEELSDEVMDRIAALWRPPSPVKLIEFYELIGEEARSLIRASLPDGQRLKPMDAIHLATARRWSCSAFYTYDTKLPGFAAVVGMTIEPPKPLAPQLPWEGQVAASNSGDEPPGPAGPPEDVAG